MMTAILTDMQVGLQIAVKDHLAAAVTFRPKIVRDILAFDQGPNFGRTKL